MRTPSFSGCTSTHTRPGLQVYAAVLGLRSVRHDHVLGELCRRERPERRVDLLRLQLRQLKEFLDEGT